MQPMMKIRKDARQLVGLFCVMGASLPSSYAYGQTITANVFDTVVPFSYNRGRNESVTDRARPDYEAIGVPLGGFMVFPTIKAQLGSSDNVYQTADNRVSDGFVMISPKVKIASNWAVNSLVFEASGNFKRFFKETPRNENGWVTGLSGKFSIDPEKTVGFTVRTQRYYESQFTGAAQNNISTPVRAQASTAALSAETRMARVRGVLAGDFTHVNFLPAISRLGAIVNQDDRDRDIGRVVGHLEYGLTPQVGVFVEGAGTFTGYRTPLATGLANRNSGEGRFVAGLSLDLAAKIRGSVSVGYLNRNYRSPLYSDVSGLTLNAKAEYFPSQLTTVSLSARREVEDAIFAGTGGYFNTGATLRVDHELLRNLILNAAADYERDTYRGVVAKATIIRATAGAEYFVNNLFGLNGSVYYARRRSDAAQIGPTLREIRFLVGVTLHR